MKYREVAFFGKGQGLTYDGGCECMRVRVEKLPEEFREPRDQFFGRIHWMYIEITMILTGIALKTLTVSQGLDSGN